MSLTHTFNLTAVQTPTPQVAAFQLFKQNSTNPGIAPNSTSYAVGDTLAVVTKFNQLALSLDVGQAYGGGGFGILWGLGLTEATSGLIVNMGGGQANIKGLTDSVSGQAIILPANLTSYVYLLNTTAATYVASSLTPPSAYCCYLGAVTTNSSGITGIDDSGVVYIRGNHLVRRTADTTIPTDSPPSNLSLITIGATKTWEWNGTVHLQRPVFVGDHLNQNYTETTGSGSIALTTSSANIQRVRPTGTTSVLLPASGSVLPSQYFEIWHDGTGFNLTVKDSTGTQSIVTLTAGEYWQARAIVSNGNYNWPASGSALSYP